MSGTTLSGYTTETISNVANEKPDFKLLSALVNQLGEKTPIIAEGRIGTGIGGGIIIDGKLIKGQGNAGEFGHICIEKNGRQCRCGRKGCLETYVSRKLLQEQIEKAVQNKNPSLPSLDTGTIIHLIKSNHPEVMKIFHQHIDYLACGLENLFNILDPDLIVLGGEFSRLGNVLITNLQARLLRPVKITISSSGNNAGIIGTALLAIENLQ